MNVAQYTFQSPSPNPVQVGRLIPSSVEQDNTKNSSSVQPMAASTAKTPEQWLKSDTTQVQKVKPTVTQDAIDTYA